MDSESNDLTRVLLAVLFIVALIATSAWILRPFLLAFMWAVMIAVATWPLLLVVQRRLAGSRTAATAVMTAALLIVVLLPIALAIDTVADNADHAGEVIKSYLDQGIPAPPDWVARLPVAGARIAEKWGEFSALTPGDLQARLAPYSRDAARWVLSTAGSLAVFLVQLLLTAILIVVLYAKGEELVGGLRAFAVRLVGPRGAFSLVLGAQAIRAVALGVVGAALVQSVIGGIGFAVAGVPFAVLLTALMFVLGIAQIGAGPVLILATVWMYWKSEALPATLFLAWNVFVGSVDNILRPLLIKQGADLPLLLIFAGVIGGLLAFGVIGLFVGPVVLAIAYTELVAWTRGERVEAAEDQAPTPAA